MVDIAASLSLTPSTKAFDPAAVAGVEVADIQAFGDILAGQITASADASTPPALLSLRPTPFSALSLPAGKRQADGKILPGAAAVLPDAPVVDAENTGRPILPGTAAPSAETAVAKVLTVRVPLKAVENSQALEFAPEAAAVEHGPVVNTPIKAAAQVVRDPRTVTKDAATGQSAPASDEAASPVDQPVLADPGVIARELPGSTLLAVLPSPTPISVDVQVAQPVAVSATISDITTADAAASAPAMPNQPVRFAQVQNRPEQMVPRSVEPRPTPAAGKPSGAPLSTDRTLVASIALAEPNSPVGVGSPFSIGTAGPTVDRPQGIAAAPGAFVPPAAKSPNANDQLGPIAFVVPPARAFVGNGTPAGKTNGLIVAEAAVRIVSAALVPAQASTAPALGSAATPETVAPAAATPTFLGTAIGDGVEVAQPVVAGLFARPSNAAAADHAPTIERTLPEFASAPAAVVADAPALPSSLTGAPNVALTPAPQGASQYDFAALVDRLIEARNASAPHAVTASVHHTEFGRVSLQFQQEGKDLSVSMTSADPEFAMAVQAAIPADRSAPNAETLQRGQTYMSGQASSPSTHQDNAGQRSAEPGHQGREGQQQGRNSRGRPDGPNPARAWPDPDQPQSRGGIFA